jgi:hypothetical protein
MSYYCFRNNIRYEEISLFVKDCSLTILHQEGVSYQLFILLYSQSFFLSIIYQSFIGIIKRYTIRANDTLRYSDK